MARNYFSQLPDFEYVNRTEDGKRISDYTQVKNLFKRGKLREDIFQETTFFEQYQYKVMIVQIMLHKKFMEMLV